tara:strand:- start:73 stop:6240 length:6168 start_codon:yes stop_codon:yes gene_type:complete
MPINQENYSQNQLDLILKGTTENQTLSTDDYVRLSVYEEATDVFVGRFYSNALTPDNIPQIEVYNLNGTISVKPNEILEANYVAGGNYKLEFDFLKNVFSLIPATSVADNPKFIITEIAPSRKEIRVIARNNGDDILFDNDFMIEFMSSLSPAGSYTYDWVLTFNKDKNISINNFTFDEISNPEKISLILRLDKPIPATYKRLDKVNIEKEVINTQIQNIIYVSNITSTFAGSGLTPDPSVWTREVVYEADSAENYEQLVVSSSFTENTFNDIVTKQKGEVNLNVDFSKFENHVFFGSAKKKLQNFKTKVGKIQGQLNLISQSLSTAHNVGTFTGSTIPDLRKNAFNEITNIKKTFTPYEKFLYDDNQSYSTSSAPGLGLNHAHTIPVTQNSGQYSLLTNQEGFKVVHKHEPNPAGNTFIDLFTDQYFADDTPFFNYTGSLYLSFLMKADDTISDTMHADQDIGNGRFVWENSNKVGYGGYPRIPQEALHQEFILRPNTTGSHFQRFILHASQSHWRPTGSVTLNDAGVQDVSLIPQDNASFTGNNNVYYSILSSSVQVTSASMTHTEKISLPENYSGLGTSLTSSNHPFHGSVLPAGELFRIYYRAQDISGTEATASFITDVKVTKNNPLNTQPFSFIYPTGSTEFDTWYNGIYSQAETYDNNNIHSLVHNVPEQVITSSDDVQTFLDMWGEHFDGVRNHIDTFKTFYNRSYNEKTSMPSNLLPILGANLGWELINPFSSSLSDYFSTLTGSLSTMQDVTNNTWRKIINNLVYIYKSKGTQNSLRALLNIYGYPPDLITVTEHGGSMQEHNPIIIDDTFSTFNSGLKASSGNVSFIEEPIMYRMMNFNQFNEGIQLDWHMNGANGTGMEFTMIPTVTNVSMSLLESSGSLTESLWDLQYVPSASSPTVGSLRFRLHHGIDAPASATSSLSLNASSASTDYFTIGDDKMFNVFMGIHNSEYTVVVSQKENDSINLFTTASLNMTDEVIAGNISVANIANSTFAFLGSGSRHPLSASNLYVGRTYTGSLADIRMWKGFQSASKIKQHTLNPVSIVGNHFNSQESELIYRFKLNENTIPGSTGRIKDSNPTNIKDFSRDTAFNISNGMYITKIIDTFKFLPRTDGVSHRNTNMVTTDMDRGFMKHNLSPIKNSFNPNLDEKSNNKREVSEVVSFTKSPIDKIDDYITQVLADKDISQYFSKWSDTYEPFYEDLDDLRNKIMSGVSVDINKYINTVAKLFNPSIIEAVESILPLSSRFDTGVEIRQSILERNKIQYKKSSVFRIPVHLGTLENIYNITSTIVDLPKGNLENHQPDLSLSFITPPKGEIQTSVDGYTYSINYLSIYNSNNINIYEDIIDFNVKNIELINFNTISLIKQDNNFKINFVNPIQSNVMDLYNDFINYKIEYTKPLDVILSNVNGKTQFYNFSINNINNLINFDVINIYEDFVNYNINYLKIYSTNLQNWPFEQILTEYLTVLETEIQEHKFKEFSTSYSPIHQFNIDEWEYQDFNMNYINLYQSNNLSIIDVDDFSYNSLKLEYNNISENKLKRWPFESFGGSFINVYSDNLENWPFENFSITKLNIIEENIEQWPFESFSSNYNEVYETDIQLSYDSEFDKNQYSLSVSENDSTEATLSMQFFVSSTTKANDPANWDGGTITLRDGNGVRRTYIFDDDGTGDNGDLDGSGRVIVQIIGNSSWPQQRTALVNALAHANGHNGSIRTTNTSKGLLLTQDVGGTVGNTSVSVTGLNALDGGTSIGGVLVSSAASFTTSFTGGVDFNFKNYIEKRDKFKMEYIDVYSKDVFDVQNLMWVDRKQSPLKTWGTNPSDTWIMNMAVSGSGSRNYNTGYYNDTVFNYMIQDMEYISGSRKKKICAEILQSNEVLDYDRACVDPEDYCDSSDWRCFYNRLILDDGLTGDIYQSYFGDSGGTSPIKGRPIGKTTFIATASNGDLIYPSNHHINYSTTKDQMRFLFYEKTPTSITVIDRNNEFDETNHNKGIQFEGDLFPRESVYTLQVEGADTENILRVEKKTDRPTTGGKIENIRKGRRNPNKKGPTGPK